MPSHLFPKPYHEPSRKAQGNLEFTQNRFSHASECRGKRATKNGSLENQNIYQKMQEKNAKNDSFILHDGPPFTNGDVHVGTALNKTLKDVITRYKNSCGFRTPYIPGWDCHGLPIEHKVSKALQKEKKEFDVLSLRQACQEFSKSFIETQRAQFQDWECLQIGNRNTKLWMVAMRLQ